ncbi:MAG: ThuA domain-containing protein [Chloracidobacterium sp.]|nr:ThuA domain-containing protein [Chloracidobacterium sp.]
MALALCLFALNFQKEERDLLVYNGVSGPGRGKHIVLIAGDEEYRSEEALPMLAKILAVRHGFTCTVLFSINPADGAIDPNNHYNIPGLEELERADMLVLFTRFRELPDAQMKYFDDFLRSGKPILGIRTATHAFAFEKNKQSPYARWDWRSEEWPGGFGQQILGATWPRSGGHHGKHGEESTRGVINPKLKAHPILKGVDDIWGPTDVYGVFNLPADAQILVYGQVLEGMRPEDKPAPGPKNDPMMPLVWIRNYTAEGGKTSRVICSTIGSAVDFESEGLRRLMVNAVYWAVGLEKSIPVHNDVDYVGGYLPSYFGFEGFKKGVKPSDIKLQ